MTVPEPSDLDLDYAAELFMEHSQGIPRKDFTKHFGSDRRGRKIVQHLVEQGILAIIVVPKDFDDGRGNVYREARTPEELSTEDALLMSRIVHLEKRRRGLKQAWARSGMQPIQDTLLQE
jgi:hypothetical protein